MDKADWAQITIEDQTDTTIQNIRAKAKSRLFTGFCYYCYSPVGSPHIFCDPGCFEDWETEQKMDRIEGRT
jgi:hypothetical protein